MPSSPLLPAPDLKPFVWGVGGCHVSVGVAVVGVEGGEGSRWGVDI